MTARSPPAVARTRATTHAVISSTHLGIGLRQSGARASNLDAARRLARRRQLVCFAEDDQHWHAQLLEHRTWVVVED
jgi:hypothetical protein